MHWSLDQVRDLEVEEYRELLEWAQSKGKPEDSLDMDAVIDAKRGKDRAE